MTTAIIALLAGAAGAVLGAWLMRARAAKGLDEILERRVGERLRESEAAIDQRLEALRKEFASAESRAAHQAPAATPPAQTKSPDEILPILAAAVCAYLGKPARIRGVRPQAQAIGRSSWAMQGRALVQGSHNLERPRG